MQIIITISLLLIIATVIIYKVNDKFEKREFIILLATIFLLTIAFLYYENKQDNYLPMLVQGKICPFLVKPVNIILLLFSINFKEASSKIKDSTFAHKT